MSEKQIQDIYFTLIGVMKEEFRVPGVENLFAEGSDCFCWYGEMLDAYAHLCDRLGVEDEDEDVETIISSLMCIEREVGRKMFVYGMKFAPNKQ